MSSVLITGASRSIGRAQGVLPAMRQRGAGRLQRPANGHWEALAESVFGLILGFELKRRLPKEGVNVEVRIVPAHVRGQVEKEL